MHSECRLPWWVSLPGQGLGRIFEFQMQQVSRRTCWKFVRSHMASIPYQIWSNKNLMTFEGMVSHVRRLRFLKPFWFYSGEQIPSCSDLSSLLPGRGRMCTRWNRCLGDWGTFHWIILVVDLCMFHLRTTQGLDCPSLGLGQNLTYPKMSSTIIPQHRFSTDFGTPKWALGFFAASHRWSMAVSLKSLWPSSRWSTHRPLETQPQRGHGGRGGPAGCWCQWWLASGKLSHNYGKSPSLMGKSTY